MADTTSTLRARLQVEGADDLVRAFQASSNASQKLETQLGKLGTSLTNIEHRFDEIKALALGGLATSKFVSEFGKFQKTLFDLNATSKVTGQSFKDMKSSIESLTDTTSHSKAEIAGFYKQVSDGIRGIKLTSDEFSKLTKTLTSEFGPSIGDVSDAMKDLTAIQNKNIDVLKTLNVNLSDKQIQKYAGALMRVYGISEKQAESLARTQKAFRDQGTAVDEEQQNLRKFNEQMQQLEKAFKNLVLEIGQPVAEALGNMSKHIKDAVVWFNELIKGSDTLKSAFGWLPAVAAGIGGITLAVKALKGVMGVGSSLTNIFAGKAAGGRGAVPGAGGAGGGAGMAGFGRFSFVGDALKVFVVDSGSGFADALGGGGGKGRGRRGRGRSSAASRSRARGGSSKIGMLGKAGSLAGGFLKGGGAGLIAGIGGELAGDALESSGHNQLGAGAHAVGNVAGMASTGAGLGSLVGPLGALIGGILGAGLGIIDSFDNIKEALGFATPDKGDTPKFSGDVTKLTPINLALPQTKGSGPNVSEESDITARIEKNKLLTEQSVAANAQLAQEAMLYSNNVGDAFKYLTANVSARKEEGKLLKELIASSETELITINGKVAAAKSEGMDQKTIEGLLEVQKAIQVDILSTRGKLATVNVDITNQYKQQSAVLRQQTETRSLIVDSLQAELDLANSMFLGMAPSLEKQMQIVDAIRQQSSAIDTEIAQYQEMQRAGIGGIETQQTLIRLQTEKTRLAQKELDITKNLREGYLNAIQAFTNVEGAFSKVILTQENGVDKMMEQFGAHGAAGAGHKFGADAPAVQWNPDGSMKMGENQQQWATRYNKINDYNPFAVPSAARAGNDFQQSLMNQQLIGKSGSGSGVFSAPSGASPSAAGGKNGITDAINDSILKDLVRGAQGPSGSSGAAGPSGIATEVKRAKDEMNREAVKNRSEATKNTGAVESGMSGAMQTTYNQYISNLQKQNEAVNKYLNNNSWDKIAADGGDFGTTIGARSHKGGGAGGKGRGGQAGGRAGIRNSNLQRDNFKQLAGAIAHISSKEALKDRTDYAKDHPYQAPGQKASWVGKTGADKFADLNARTAPGAVSTDKFDGSWKSVKSSVPSLAAQAPDFTPISGIARGVNPGVKSLNVETKRQADAMDDMLAMAKKRVGGDVFTDGANSVSPDKLFGKFKEREDRGDYAVMKTTLGDEKWKQVTEDTFGDLARNSETQVKALESIDKNTGAIAPSSTTQATSATNQYPGPGFMSGAVPGHATGGAIPGFGGGDKHPAMLEGGEFVLRKEAVKAMGLSNVFAMNQMATGGLVGGAVPSPSMARSGGGGFAPRFAINVRGDTAHSILQTVTKQLHSTISDLWAPSGTSGRSFDMNNNG